MSLERILVGVDGSPDSLAALTWAADLAEQTGAEVVAVHAVGLLEQERPDLHETFESGWCAPLDRAGIRCRRLLRYGNPVTALLSTAEEVGADLLVVGSRGIGGHAELLLGSTSSQVAQRAHQPVTIIPGLREQELGAAPAPGQEQLLLQDGRAVTVRPVARSDESGLADLLGQVGPEDVRARLSGELVARTGGTYVALDGGRVVGVGRYQPSDEPRLADVVVAVDDAWCGIGLGTRLLVVLGMHAVEQGIERFRARYRTDQGDVVRVAAASGMPHRVSTDGELHTVEIDLVTSGA